MIALLAVLLSLTAAAALAGDYPTETDPLPEGLDYGDLAGMSWWNRHRSEIHNVDRMGRPRKPGVDWHLPDCAGDGKFECICDIGGRP